MKDAIRRCEATGLKYENGKKHPRITDPKTGRSVSISRTPSDHRAVQNMLRDVRKYLGVDVT
jgi:hypothetical protein